MLELLNNKIFIHCQAFKKIQIKNFIPYSKKTSNFYIRSFDPSNNFYVRNYLSVFYVFLLISNLDIFNNISRAKSSL